jgi:hypothetical protein
MTTPTTPMASIETANARTRMPRRRSGSVIAPEKPSVVNSHHDTNEPHMKISPWAKLMSSMIPYTIVYPSAISA